MLEPIGSITSIIPNVLERPREEVNVNVTGLNDQFIELRSSIDTLFRKLAGLDQKLAGVLEAFDNDTSATLYGVHTLEENVKGWHRDVSRRIEETDTRLEEFTRQITTRLDVADSIRDETPTPSEVERRVSPRETTEEDILEENQDETLEVSTPRAGAKHPARQAVELGQSSVRNRSSRMRVASTPQKTRTYTSKRAPVVHYKGDPSDDTGSSESSSDDHYHRRGSQSHRSSRRTSSRKSKRDDASDLEGEFDSRTDDPYFILVEPKVKFPPFLTVLSFKSYRLMNKSQIYNSKWAGKIGSFKRKVSSDIPDENKFGGEDPIAILRFLQDYREACNHNAMNEGCALHLLSSFLKGSARDGLNGFLANVNGTPEYSYLGAVRYLLKTHAPEPRLNNEFRRIATLQMRPGDSITEFGRRVLNHSLRLGTAISDYEKIRAFTSGIPDDIHAFVNTATSDATSFDEIVQAAETAWTALRGQAEVTQAPRKSLPLVRRNNRPTGPGYAITTTDYNPPEGWRMSNTMKKDNEAPTRKLSCFACGEGHPIYECPTLNEEQQKLAKQVWDRRVANRRDAGRNTTFKYADNSRPRPSYAIKDEDRDSEAEEYTAILELSQENEDGN
jgi:hypothetical protein